MNELVEPFERRLAEVSSAAVIRQIQAGGAADALWNAIEQSGFLEALVPEQRGGQGLSLAEVFGLLVAEGRHAVPAPVGHTMLARAVILTAGADAPQGPIAIAPQAQLLQADGTMVCRHVPYATVARWFIVPLPQGWRLLARSDARCVPCGIQGSLHADLHWPSSVKAVHSVSTDFAWREAGAVLAAAQMAGAMERALQVTLQFANDRVQFGKSIGKFQAIQHQLAVMAEQVAAARMAAEMGCLADGVSPSPLRAAQAKARASEAAGMVAPMAHAIHGAIGITAELDLQIYTRYIHEHRADYGSELYWNQRLGRALLAQSASTLDFMRDALLPA